MRVNTYTDLFEVVAEVFNSLKCFSMLKFVILFFVSHFIFPIKKSMFHLKREKKQHFKHTALNTYLSVVQPSSLVSINVKATTSTASVFPPYQTFLF